MKIEIKDNKMHPFGLLNNGDVFISDEKLYIKINDSSIFNTLNLTEMKVCGVVQDVLVEPVEATLVVDRK